MRDLTCAGTELEEIVSRKIDSIKARSKSKTRLSSKKEKREANNRRGQGAQSEERDAAPTSTSLLREQASENLSSKKSRSGQKKRHYSESVSTRGRSITPLAAEDNTRSRRLSRRKQKGQRSKSTNTRNGRSFHSQMAARSRAHSVTKRSGFGVRNNSTKSGDASTPFRGILSLSQRLGRTIAVKAKVDGVPTENVEPEIGSTTVCTKEVNAEKNVEKSGDASTPFRGLLSLSQRLGRTITVKTKEDGVPTKNVEPEIGSTTVCTKEVNAEKKVENNDGKDPDTENIARTQGTKLAVEKEDSKLGTLSHHKASKALLESPASAHLEMPFQHGPEDKYVNPEDEREEDSKRLEALHEGWVELMQKNPKERSEAISKLWEARSGDLTESGSEPGIDGFLKGFDKFLNLFCDMDFADDLMHVMSEGSIDDTASFLPESVAPKLSMASLQEDSDDQKLAEEKEKS